MTHNYAHIPPKLGMILSDFFNLLAGGNAFFICFCNKESTDMLLKKQQQRPGHAQDKACTSIGYLHAFP